MFVLCFSLLQVVSMREHRGVFLGSLEKPFSFSRNIQSGSLWAGLTVYNCSWVSLCLCVCPYCSVWHWTEHRTHTHTQYDMTEKTKLCDSCIYYAKGTSAALIWDHTFLKLVVFWGNPPLLLKHHSVSLETQCDAGTYNTSVVKC